MRQIFIVMHRVMVIVFNSSMCVYVCVLIVGTDIGHVKVMVFDSNVCACVCVCVDRGFKHRSHQDLGV